jgi:hypothetical protein
MTARKGRIDYRAIAARAKVQADPRATLAALVVIVQYRRKKNLDNTWITMAGFDDHMVAAIYRDQCAITNDESEFRTVSLSGRS